MARRANVLAAWGDTGPTIGSVLGAAVERLPEPGDLGRGVVAGWHPAIEGPDRRLVGHAALNLRGLLRPGPRAGLGRVEMSDRFWAAAGRIA